MIKIYFFLILVIASGISRADVRIELAFPQTEIKQGNLFDATLTIDMDAAQQFEIQKLNGVTAGDTIYFHKLSPLLRSEASGSLSSEVSIVFLKVPEVSSLKFKVNDKSIDLTWEDVQVVPTKEARKFIFENFSIPGRKDFLFWILLGLGIVVAGVTGVLINSRLKIARSEKKRRFLLKENILHVDTYEGVINVWQNKIQYVREFPHIEYPLKNLEKTLFEHVFKPSQSEHERSEVMKAYRNFVSEIREGFNGI